jgi:hypothetical protein
MRKHLTPAALAALALGDIHNFDTAATPGGIEAQEAAGQAIFVANSTLPKECPRAELEKMGVKFGPDQDDLFVKVILPAGWSKRATDHSMWSDLLDDKGRKRGAIFYKAAFYDRSAHMNVTRRYDVNEFWMCDAEGNRAEYGKHTHVCTVVSDAGTVLQRFSIRPNAYSKENREQQERDRIFATAWLVERFPKWTDATAYWD